MEPASKCLGFYEYHTVGYTTLWDLVSTEPILAQEFRFWLGPGSARALADPGEMPEAHEAASATGS